MRRMKIWRSVVMFIWCAAFFAVPLIHGGPIYTFWTWLSVVLGMVLGGLLVFMAMMPETA